MDEDVAGKERYFHIGQDEEWTLVTHSDCMKREPALATLMSRSGCGCTLGHKPIPVQGIEAPSHACTTTKTEEENSVPRFTVINYEQRTHGALATDDSWEYKKATSP
jgi:hypothetical protein